MSEQTRTSPLDAIAGLGRYVRLLAPDRWRPSKLLKQERKLS